MAVADVPLKAVVWDNFVLYPLSSLYSLGCLVAFSVLLTRCRQQQAYRRASLSLAVSLVLLLGQPWIYATPTQPFSVSLAGLAMTACWSMLEWGFLQPPPATVKHVLRSCLFCNMMSGVAKVPKRRVRRMAAEAVAEAMPGSLKQQFGVAPPTEEAAADNTHTVQDNTHTVQHRKPEAGNRPVIHVRAYSSTNNNTQPAAPKCSTILASATPSLTTTHAPAAGSRLLSSDFTEATRTLATASTCPFQAWRAVLHALVTYDVLYALLSCSSGCLCTATTVQPAAFPASSMCLLGRLLGPKLGYFAFSMAAGMLLSVQMDMGYSVARACLLMVGETDLVDNLPVRAFNSLHMTSSITDLWGNRWHAFLRYHFEGLGYKVADTTAWPTVKQLLPHTAHKRAFTTTRMLVVFAMSGLLHEYITWAAWGVITWNYMTYFMLHCFILLAEGHAAAAFPNRAAATPRCVGRIWAMSVMLLLAPLFTEAYRQHDFFAHAVHPLLVPVSANIMRRAGVCSCNM